MDRCFKSTQTDTDVKYSNILTRVQMQIIEVSYVFSGIFFSELILCFGFHN